MSNCYCPICGKPLHDKSMSGLGGNQHRCSEKTLRGIDAVAKVDRCEDYQKPTLRLAMTTATATLLRSKASLRQRACATVCTLMTWPNFSRKKGWTNDQPESESMTILWFILLAIPTWTIFCCWMANRKEWR